MHSAVVEVPLPVTYEIQFAKGPARGVVLLLHGYMQRGTVIMKKMAALFPDDIHVVAPNGPFLVPPPLDNLEGKAGYAWYFFNPKTGEYLYEMDTAVAFLQGLMDHLGFESLPKWIFGFSQGGYIAPFAGMALTNVRQVMGLNARYRSEVLPRGLSFPLDAVHGEGDTLVDIARSRRCHQDMLERDCDGLFAAVPSVGHEMNRAMIQKAIELWRR